MFPCGLIRSRALELAAGVLMTVIQLVTITFLNLENPREADVCSCFGNAK